MTALLDAALIVKDEELHLPACLEALGRLRPLLGRICVYDTGSTDRTVEICEAAGALVRRGYWDSDFARARNEATAMTSATWVLHVDADETVVADPARLTTLLERATAQGHDIIYYPIRSWDRGRLIGDAAIGRLVRRATTTFVGRVHEHAVGRDGASTAGAGVPADLLMAHHQGYSGAETLRRKSERNIEISQAEVAACRQNDAPQSELGLALVHRARAAFNLGRVEAAKTDLVEARGLTEAGLLQRYAGELLVEQGLLEEDYGSAAELLGRLIDEGSDAGWTRWQTAKLQAADGDFASAWRLMAGISTVRTSLGESEPESRVLRDRARYALDAGEIEDAVATVALLVTKHGRTEHLPMLLTAWQGWPPAIVGRLLLESRGPFHAAIRDALLAQGDAGAAAVAAFDSHVPA